MDFTYNMKAYKDDKYHENIWCVCQYQKSEYKIFILLIVPTYFILLIKILLLYYIFAFS